MSKANIKLKQIGNRITVERLTYQGDPFQPAPETLKKTEIVLDDFIEDEDEAWRIYCTYRSSYYIYKENGKQMCTASLIKLYAVYKDEAHPKAPLTYGFLSMQAHMTETKIDAEHNAKA